MQRDLGRLAAETFDLLVVGGGIHGACAAREAALRGWSVALVERADFGAATSANSLKIIHGGLRHLQRFDVAGLRESVRERSMWLRTAPHLVRPLGMLVAARGAGREGPLALRAALGLADALGGSRNRGLHTERHLRASRLLSRAACLARCPALEPLRPQAAALWYDAQVVDSERLTLATVLSAAEAGAAVANHAPVESLSFDPRLVPPLGVVARLRDAVGGAGLEVRARSLILAAGPWGPRLLGRTEPELPMAVGFNVVLRGRACDDAIGVRLAAAEDDPAGGGERYFFITPWRESTLVGTAYRRHQGNLDPLPAVEWRRLLVAVDAALPDLGLGRREVVRLHRGYVPLSATGDGLESRDRVRDHAAQGLHGALSIVSSKLTTARACAARAVARIARHLGRDEMGAETLRLPLHGGEEGWDAFLEGRASKAHPVATRLAPAYGARLPALLRTFDRHPDWSEPVVAGLPLLRGELLHGVAEEAACHLDDLLLRRTDACAEGCPPPDLLTAAGDIVGEALAWSQSRRRDEIDRVRLACAVPEA